MPVFGDPAATEPAPTAEPELIVDPAPEEDAGEAEESVAAAPALPSTSANDPAEAVAGQGGNAVPVDEQPTVPIDFNINGGGSNPAAPGGPGGGGSGGGDGDGSGGDGSGGGGGDGSGGSAGGSGNAALSDSAGTEADALTSDSSSSSIIVDEESRVAAEDPRVEVLLPHADTRSTDPESAPADGGFVLSNRSAALLAVAGAGASLPSLSSSVAPALGFFLAAVRRRRDDEEPKFDAPGRPG